MNAFQTLARGTAAFGLAIGVATASVQAGDSSSARRATDAATGGAGEVLLWHAAARDGIARHKPNQQAALRLLAYLSLAQHRAAEAMQGEPSATEAAWDELFDVASRDTLQSLMPAQATQWRNLADALAATRASSASADELTRARALGETAARETVQRAQHDGFDATWTGTLPDGATAWHSQLQPPRPPHLPAFGRMRPLFLRSGDAVRPPAPPAPGSAAFSAALAEVRARVASGDPRLLARAKRWEMTTGSLVAGFWDETAARLAARNGLSGAATSRVMLLTLGASLDANIACHDAKYAYWAARPSQIDASIRPLVGLPNHPSYPSNHACDSGAAADVLGELFPAQRDTMAALAREAGESRIDGGIHYRFDIDAGLAIGRAASAAALRTTGSADVAAELP